MQGGALQMVNHGLSTGGLFALVGMLYERYHTRQIGDYGGLARTLPMLATMFVIFTFSSIGLPGLNGFAGEFLLLIGMFQRGWAEAPAVWACQWQAISVISTFGVVLGAWYMLWLVQRVFFGPLKEKHRAARPSRAGPRPVAARNAGLGAAGGVHVLDRPGAAAFLGADGQPTAAALAAGATASFDQQYLAAACQRGRLPPACPGSSARVD